MLYGSILRFITSSDDKSWRYSSISNEDIERGDQFARLMNIVCKYISEQKNVGFKDVIDEPNCIKTDVVNIRNEAAHKGYVADNGTQIYIEKSRTYVDKDEIINFILLIASELTPSITEIKNRDVREGGEVVYASVTSGKLLAIINSVINKVQSVVRYMGAKWGLLGVLVLLLVVLGYYRYKNSDVPISYINVPKVKRIELYDRAINNTLTEDYVKRMQSDVQRFETIKKEVENE